MINYDGRRFRSLDPDEESAIAHYHQQGDLLWGEFEGGSIKRGSLCGRCLPDGELEFGYVSVSITGEVITGHCHSSPVLLPGGKIRLQEKWERYGAHASAGNSEIEEL
jgi:hypothetical protein